MLFLVIDASCLTVSHSKILNRTTTLENSPWIIDLEEGHPLIRDYQSQTGAMVTQVEASRSYQVKNREEHVMNLPKGLDCTQLVEIDRDYNQFALAICRERQTFLQKGIFVEHSTSRMTAVACSNN